MKRSLASMLLALASVWAVGARAADAREMKVDFDFPAPTFTPDGRGDVIPHLPGLLNTLDAGMPVVPVKAITLVVPAGLAIGEVLLEAGDHVRYEMSFARSYGSIPLSWRNAPPRNVHRIAEPTIPAGGFPAAHLVADKQTLHGAQLATLLVYPLVVASDRRSADFVSHGSVRVTLRPANRAVTPLLPNQAEDVQAVVENPEVVATYAVNNARREGDYEYLILTTAKWTGAFEELRKGLEERKLRSKVVDIKTLGQRPGRDEPEKIRNFIREEYKGHGVQYVLLAGKGRTSGGGDVVPARKLWSKIRAYMMGSWSDVEENISSDTYYACLDGSFNGNGNDKWGEPNDGDGGGDVDFECEVSVGRVVIESADDAKNFVSKTLWAYHNKSPRKALLAGEELFPEKDIFGDEYMDQLIVESSDHGYSTKGYTADWTLDKLYDRGGKWSGSTAKAKLNSGGYGMVNHLGHSNQSYNMRMSSSDIASFKNDVPYIYYSQGCLAAKFPVGSFIDKLVKHKYGAVVAIGNSTYGLAPEDPQPDSTKTPGASHMLHRQFIHSLMGTENRILGKAHLDSKRAFNSLKSAQEIRWVDWGAHYFGDPSLPLNN